MRGLEPLFYWSSKWFCLAARSAVASPIPPLAAALSFESFRFTWTRSNPASLAALDVALSNSSSLRGRRHRASSALQVSADPVKQLA